MILKIGIERIDGITISGGEPFAQPFELKKFLQKISSKVEDILVFSGYTYEELLKRKAPVYPVIKYGELPSEIYPAIQSMKGSVPKNIWIVQAYLQVIFARCIPLLTLTEKSQVGSNDLIYQTVSYISANFRKSFLLEDMAKDLGVSKYVLSRVFSKTFHRKFNQYLNDARLGYAKQRLENTNDPITTICLDSGYESQRTFNRVFKEKYMVSPSEYRKKLLL